MHVAVTGANGFLGSHLVPALIAAGHEATALVRPGASLRWLAGTAARIVAVPPGDTPRLAAALAGVDAVCHLAGATRVRPDAEYAAVNVGGTRAVLAALATARPAPRRLVLCSSLAAVGPSPPDRALTEDDPPLPVGVYGQSKRDAEELVLAAADRLEVVVLRPTAIYGPRDVDMFQVFQLAARGVYVRIGRGVRLYNYLHVADAAQAFVKACSASDAPGGCFLLGDTTNYSAAETEFHLARAVGVRPRLTLRLPELAVRAAAELAELVTARAARPPTLNRDKARILTAGSFAINVDRARARLGFAPAHDLATGFAATAAWYRREGWL